jgi:hypothetical protein
MAAITTVAIGAAAAGYQSYQGKENKRKAQNALQDYNRQDLDKSNAYENIPISTVGSDLMREESQRNSANIVDAMRNGGSRGIAMLPAVVANTNRQNQESRAYLDDQVNKRNYAISGDQTAIRGMKEDRENADLAGLGQQMQVGRQDMWSGIRGLGSAAMSFANNYTTSPNPQVEGVTSHLSPASLNPIKPVGITASTPDYTSMLRNYNKF